MASLAFDVSATQPNSSLRAMPLIESVTPSGKMRSVEALRAIDKVEGITKAERLVLYALAEFAGAGPNGLECHPGIKTIAGRARISERQATRVVHSLRTKNIITFEDNRGGKRNSNRYVLLFANPDISNPDTRNPDIANANPDKSSTQTLTNKSVTLTNQHANPDTAMSGEWFEGLEGFNEWKQQWENLPSNYSFDGSLFGNFKDHSSHPSKFLHFGEAFAQIEEFEKKPEDLLKQILAGAPAQRNQTCDSGRPKHGEFLQPGYRFSNWIAWCGHEYCYSSTRSPDSGCQACKSEHEDLWKDETERRRGSLPVRQFDIGTPATCPDHGHFILWFELAEYSGEYERVCGKFKVTFGYDCPGCEADWIDREQTRESLNLSKEQWERGGKQIMAAIDYATAERKASEQ